ncbi:MAG: LysR substrate-binding domain-containing protein [Gammaproteobacteria bacterium]|nr:LysR substrate-binding domain-containing protein [Gammaproteobacteria bacterium]
MRFRNFDNLRSFIVVAGHLNMGAAADELNLTKGAISYQIQQLEAELGFDVFSRSKRKLSLTEKGSNLLQVCRTLFDNVEREIVALRQQNRDRITIGMATYFASRWLSPRLMHFITEHPEIGLRIQPLVDLMDLRANDLDLAVRWGKGEWDDETLETELIFQCPALLTASREIGEQITAQGVASVINRQTLLHDRDGSEAWMDWFDAAGLEWSPGSNDLVIPDPNVRVQAVIDGQGIALYDFLVDDEVRAGRLYQYQPVKLDAYGYYLVYPRGAKSGSAIITFRDWIMQEADPG